MTPAAHDMDPRIEKYLANYAEPEAAQITGMQRRYDFSLVIPAYQETGEQVTRSWHRLPHSVSCLVIIVINAPTSDDPTGHILYETLTADNPLSSVGPGLTHIATHQGPDLLLIDRFSEGRTIPAAQGVGLARKVGTDVALALYRSGIVASDWLYTTDADAILPPDYFEPADMSGAAMLYPFRHVSHDQDAFEAVQLYEVQMLYYAAALKRAGSPFGYPTVGSTITCRAKYYAAVRGYPRRNTGEDFYLLNKLRKLGAVTTLDAEPIELDGRLSTRVPIGTGRAVARLNAIPQRLFQPLFEHPYCFEQLQQLLRLLDDAADNQPRTLQAPNSIIGSYCEDAGINRRYQAKRSENPSSAVMRSFLTEGFDGLRTRQFIHRLRDQHYGRVPVADIENLDWVDLPRSSSLEPLRQRLSDIIYRTN